MCTRNTNIISAGEEGRKKDPQRGQGSKKEEKITQKRKIKPNLG